MWEARDMSSISAVEESQARIDMLLDAADRTRQARRVERASSVDRQIRSETRGDEHRSGGGPRESRVDTYA